MLRRVLKKFFRHIDMFRASLLLRSKQEPKISTIGFGIFSLLLFILFAYVFIDKAVKVVNEHQSQLKYSSFLQRNQNTSYAKNMMFAMTFDYGNISFSQIQTYFQFNAYTTNSTQLTLGFAKKNQINMVPCTSEHWSMLNQEIDNQFFKQYFCLPYVVSSITAEYQKNFLWLQIVRCKTRPNCKSQKQIQQYYQGLIDQNQHVVVYTMFMHAYPQIFKNQPLRYGIQQNIFLVPSNGIYQKVFIKFDNLVINVDSSYWPIFSNPVRQDALTYSETIYAFQQSTSQKTQRLVKIQMSLTNDEKVYNRNVTRLDDALSYVGGLFGLIVFILIFLLKSYNQYRYELHVSENSFNYDTDGYKVREKDLGMFKYLRYRIYFIIYLLTGKRMKWGDCPEMQETVFEAKKMLDVQGMYRRLDVMERLLWNRYDTHYLLAMTLQKPDTIETVSRKRLTLQYYHHIIKMRNAATVEDALKKDPASFNYLQKAHRKLSLKKRNIDEILNMVAENKEKQLKEYSSKDEFSYETQNQIFESLKNHLKMDELTQECQNIANYTLIYLEAKNIKLAEEFQQIQEQITKSFINLSQQNKKKMIGKIPLKIIHRMRLRAVKMLKQQNQDKSNKAQEPMKKQEIAQKGRSFDNLLNDMSGRGLSSDSNINYP